MNLQAICEQYAAFRKTLGELFETNGRQLKAFCRAMGPNIDIAEVSSEKVNTFLVGKGPLTTSWYVWLANCCFAHISLGFPFLLRFCDEQPGHSFYPFYCYPGALARSWRRPFPRRGVASAQAPDPDLESLPETISEFTRVGPGPCWLDGALGASNSSAPFRNRSEAFDTASPS